MVLRAVVVGLVLTSGCTCNYGAHHGDRDAGPTVDAPDEDLSTFVITPKRLLANGRAKAKLIVTLKTRTGTVLPGEIVDFVGDAGVTISPTTVTTDSEGVAIATLTGTVTGPHTISATSGARVITATLTLTPPCDAPLLGQPYVDVASAVARDFNGDDVPDLVGAVIGGVGFASGNGDGSFQPVEVSAGPITGALVGADFNGDGLVDVAGRGSGPSGIAVMLGNGDGTFAAATMANATATPSGFATGDFDHDGKLDLAVFGAHEGTPPLSVLFGNGNGTFAPEVVLTSASSSNTSTVIAAADLDGDQDVDLISSDYYTGNVALYISNGNRTFQAVRTVSLGGSSSVGAGALVAGDLDGSGSQDLVVARYYPSSITVLLNNGSATFQPPRDFAAGMVGNALAAGQLDGDGQLDIVASDGAKLYVMRGDGQGNLVTATPIATSGAMSLALADFDLDGSLDAAIGGPKTTVVRGHGASFESFVSPIEPVYSIAAGDFDNDGALDVATAPLRTGIDDRHEVRVRRGNGDGTFNAGVVYPTGLKPGTLLAADLNGDGALDLASANELDVTVLLNNGSGGFTASTVLAIPDMNRHWGFAIADFNGDGKLDIAVTREPWFPIAPKLQIALGNGNGTFGAPVEYDLPVAYIWFLATGDVNGNGTIDIVSFPLELFLGAGNGTFAAGTTIANGGSVLNGGVVLADMNADAKLDVIATSGTNMEIHRGNGDGTFMAPIAIAPGTAGNPERVVDLDGDGTLDVISFGGGGTTLVRGKPDGTFAAPLTYPNGLTDSYQRAVVGDFDGNGMLDIAAPGGILLQRACTP